MKEKGTRARQQENKGTEASQYRDVIHICTNICSRRQTPTAKLDGVFPGHLSTKDAILKD